MSAYKFKIGDSVRYIARPDSEWYLQHATVVGASYIGVCGDTCVPIDYDRGATSWPAHAQNLELINTSVTQVVQRMCLDV